MVFVLRKFFEQALSRDIEKFKARLEIEAQTKLFEYQTRFAFYHQKQTEVIGELYGLLIEAVDSASALIHPLQLNVGGKSTEEKLIETNGQCRTLQSFFRKHRIYLDEDVCNKTNSVLQHMHEVLVKFDMSQQHPGVASIAEMWRDALKQMEEEVSPVLKALESQFRRSLSAIPIPKQQNITRA